MKQAGTARARQVCVLGSAEPGSRAHDMAGAAGELLARSGITVVSGCGSPATRVAAERALAAGGFVVSIVPSDDKRADPVFEPRRQPNGAERSGQVVLELGEMCPAFVVHPAFELFIASFSRCIALRHASMYS